MASREAGGLEVECSEWILGGLVVRLGCVCVCVGAVKLRKGRSEGVSTEVSGGWLGCRVTTWEVSEGAVRETSLVC